MSKIKWLLEESLLLKISGRHIPPHTKEALEEKTPNSETLKAMEEVEAGHVKSYSSVKELMKTLKKSSGV